MGVSSGEHNKDSSSKLGPICIGKIDMPKSWALLACLRCRMLLVDLGAFVLINVYVPNAGCRRSGGPSSDRQLRVDLKERFLAALLEKATGLASAGREVCTVPLPLLGLIVHAYPSSRGCMMVRTTQRDGSSCAEAPVEVVWNPCKKRAASDPSSFPGR